MKLRSLKNTNAEGAQGGVILAVVTMIAIAIGVLIWYKLNTSLYGARGWTAGTYGAGWASYNSTWLAINTSANSVWTLFPIVAIVLIAGIILAVVMGFGRQQA